MAAMLLACTHWYLPSLSEQIVLSQYEDLSMPGKPGEIEPGYPNLFR